MEISGIGVGLHTYMLGARGEGQGKKRLPWEGKRGKERRAYWASSIGAGGRIVKAPDRNPRVLHAG